MKKTEILIIGTHPDILATIVRLVNNKPEWNGTSALGAEAAKTAFQQTPFDVVLFGGGVDETEEKELTSLFIQQHAKVICLRHYGGGSGLLYGEILQALTHTS